MDFDPAFKAFPKHWKHMASCLPTLSTLGEE